VGFAHRGGRARLDPWFFVPSRAGGGHSPPYDPGRRALGRHAPDAHPVGQLAKAVGGLLGDALPGDVGPEGLGIEEDLAEHVEVGGLGQAGQVEGVHALGRVSEVGVDLEAVHVADDQQRRVPQVLTIEEKLPVGGPQVFALALVLPAEVAAFPDVGPAIPSAGLVNAALEGEGGALWIGLRRLGVAEKVAQVQEMLLAGGPLRETDPLPLGHELLRCHGRPSGGLVAARSDCGRDCT